MTIRLLRVFFSLHLMHHCPFCFFWVVLSDCLIFSHRNAESIHSSKIEVSGFSFFDLLKIWSSNFQVHNFIIVQSFQSSMQDFCLFEIIPWAGAAAHYRVAFQDPAHNSKDSVFHLGNPLEWYSEWNVTKNEFNIAEKRRRYCVWLPHCHSKKNSCHSHSMWTICNVFLPYTLLCWN